MKIFLDTNVSIDFLLKRAPFSEDIKNIFHLSTEGKVRLFISSTSVTDIYYIISRIESSSKAKDKLKKLLTLCKVLNVGSTTITKAIHSAFKDFEDGVQNYCAKEAGIKIITTRNVKDFRESEMSILTPKELLIKIGA